MEKIGTEIEVLGNSEAIVWGCGLLFIIIVIYIIVNRK